MNILEFAMNGLGAIADALSFGLRPAAAKPVKAHVNNVKARVRRITGRGQLNKPAAQAAPSPASQTPLATSARPVPGHTKNVRHAVNSAIDPDLSPEQVRVINGVRQSMPPNEVHLLDQVREALAQERLADIAETRQQQDQQANQSQGPRLKR